MNQKTIDTLKKLPFMKNVDFDDPKARKSVVYVGLLALLILLLVAALVFRAVKGGKDPNGEDIVLLQGNPLDPNVAPVQESPLLEIPEGRDRDILGAENMMQAYGNDRVGRQPGNRDLYERADAGNRDPLGDLFGGEGSYHGYETPASGQAAATEPQQGSAPAPSSGRTSSGYSRGSSSSETRRAALEAFGLGSSSDEGGDDGYGSSSGSYGGSSSSSSRGSRRDAAESQPVYTQEFPEEEEQAAEPAPTRVRRPNGITTLDDVTPRSSVLTSLASDANDSQYIDTSDDALFKVMFLSGGKIKSGDKVRIMLIDDIIVDGVLVEHNTPLTATCSLSVRLMLTIPSVTINGRIHTLNFQAVDNDGQVGLYCPVTETAQKAEEALDVASNIAQSELMQMIPGLGGRILQSGARTVKSGTKGSSTVTVDQGYQFYITKAKKMF